MTNCLGFGGLPLCHKDSMTSDRTARPHIRLNELERAIWRRIEVPMTSTLKLIKDAQ